LNFKLKQSKKAAGNKGKEKLDIWQIILTIFKAKRLDKTILLTKRGGIGRFNKE